MMLFTVIILTKIYKNKEDVKTLCKLMRYQEINNQIKKAEENIKELLIEKEKIMETISSNKIEKEDDYGS